MSARVSTGTLNMMLNNSLYFGVESVDSVILSELFWDNIVDLIVFDIHLCTNLYFEVIKSRTPLYLELPNYNARSVR